MRDEYGCNLSKCECAHFDNTIIGNFDPKFMVFHQKYSGDMAVSAKTAHKLMTKKNGSNSTVWNAYADSTAYLWDQNIINEYVIAYELNSGLDYTVQDMLPKVHFTLKNNL